MTDDTTLLPVPSEVVRAYRSPDRRGGVVVSDRPDPYTVDPDMAEAWLSQWKHPEHLVPVDRRLYDHLAAQRPKPSVPVTRDTEWGTKVRHMETGSTAYFIGPNPGYASTLFIRKMLGERLDPEGGRRFEYFGDAHYADWEVVPDA